MSDELDKILSDKFDEIEKAKLAPAEEEETVEPVEAPSVEDEEVVAAEDAPVEDTVESVDVPEVVAEPVSQAPEYLSAAVKEKWAKLEPDVRADLLKQGKYADQLISKHAQERKKYEALDGVLANHRTMLAAQYGDEANGIKALLTLSDFATKDPSGFIQYYAQQRGIDLRGLSQSLPAQQQVDPTISALLNKVQQLEENQSKQEQIKRQTEEQEAQSLLNDFASNPANKYFNEVRDDMALLLESGKAKDLQDAYNKACRLNDQVSEMLLAEKTANMEAERRKKAQESVDKAKKASVINVSTKGVVSTEKKPVSIDDTLEEAWNRIHEAS